MKLPVPEWHPLRDWHAVERLRTESQDHDHYLRTRARDEHASGRAAVLVWVAPGWEPLGIATCGVTPLDTQRDAVVIQRLAGDPCATHLDDGRRLVSALIDRLSNAAERAGIQDILAYAPDVAHVATLVSDHQFVPMRGTKYLWSRASHQR